MNAKSKVFKGKLSAQNVAPYPFKMPDAGEGYKETGIQLSHVLPEACGGATVRYSIGSWTRWGLGLIQQGSSYVLMFFCTTKYYVKSL